MLKVKYVCALFLFRIILFSRSGYWNWNTNMQPNDPQLDDLLLRMARLCSV